MPVTPPLFRSLRRTAATLALAGALASVPAVAWGAYGQIDRWASQGTGQQAFRGPIGVATDLSNGRVHVADLSTDVDGNQVFRIQVFEANGDYVATLAEQNAGASVFFDPAFVDLAVDGAAARRYVYVTRAGESEPDRVERYNLDGTGGATIFGGSGAAQLGLNDPGPIAVVRAPGVPAADGHVYVGGRTRPAAGQPFRPAVRRYAPTGVKVGDPIYGGPTQRDEFVAAPGTTSPPAVAAAPDGTLWVLDVRPDDPTSTADDDYPETYGRLQHFALDGSRLGVIEASDALPFAATDALAVDSGGNLYVNGDAPGTIMQLSPTGALGRTVGAVGDAECQFRDAEADLAVGQGDDLFVAELFRVGLSSSARVTRLGDGGTGCGFDAAVPTATNLQASPATPVKGDEVDFTVDGADADGTVVEYQWDLDGELATGPDGYEVTTAGPTASRTYPDAGTYEVRVRAKDDDDQLSDAALLTLQVASDPPTAAFTFAPSGPTAGDTVTFDGTGSSDPDGTVARYDWDLDGSTANGFERQNAGASPTHVYATGGTYSVRLRVTDDTGQLSPTTTQQVAVAAPPVVDEPDPQPTPVPPVVVTPPPSDPPASSSNTSPPAPPVDSTPPVLTLPKGTLKPSRTGVVTFTLRCAAGESFCVGTLSVTVGARRVRKAFRVPGGTSATAKVKLDKRMLKALKRAGKLSAKLQASVSDAAGNASTASGRVVLRARKR